MKPLTLLAMLAIAAQAQVVSPKFHDQQRQIHAVLVLPAAVDMHFVGMKGGRGLPEASDKVGEWLYTDISAELAARGATVLPDPLPAAATDEAKYALSDLQRKFDSVSVQLFKKPHALEKGRYTLGDGVSDYAPAASADTLVFIRGSGSESSPNKQAFDWAMLRPFPNTFSARIAFVDAHTGEVLALATVESLRDVIKKSPEALRSSVCKAFHDLPLPGKTAAPAAGKHD